MMNFKVMGSFLSRFGRDRIGSVSIIAGFAILAIFSGIGAGIDLAHSFQMRQKISQAAAMACQYSTRTSVTNTWQAQNSATYVSAVNSYITANLLPAQGIPTGGSNAAPFTLNAASGAGDVQLSANVPTYIMKMFNFASIPVAASAHCYDSISALHSPSKSPPGTAIISESFETSGCQTAGCWYVYAPGVPPGTFISTPTSTFQSTATYTGNAGITWFVVGYCVENDYIGAIFATAALGQHSAELDCDNGSGSAGNSSISTQKWLEAGAYELRWSYHGRVDYPDYNPAYICGSQASDVSWANSTNSSGGPVANAYRTNQVNVYLDYVPNQATFPAMHTTYDNKTLAGSTLVDMCIYSNEWIQRSVKITITQAGYYWLSFAADGQNDSYGGSIDNILLCATACPGAPLDNFPQSWTAANGVTLFNDGFATPGYSGSNIVSGDITRSVGTSGGASGWPNTTASGWDIGPANQTNFLLSGAQSGSQALQIDGANGSGSAANTEISRPFLLVPGYYQVSYYYISDVTFASLSSTPGAYCGAIPSAIPGYSTTLATGSGTGVYTPTAASSTLNYDTNFVGIFMSHAQLASNPNAPAFRSAATYTNPDGSTSSTPTVPSNGISLATYSSSSAQPNPLLDFCGYSAGWTKRTANIEITKTAYYWLTASSLGTADGYGGAIDNLSLVALGSPYMSSPPANPVVIPAPLPLAGTSVSLPTIYPYYNIVADSFVP